MTWKAVAVLSLLLLPLLPTKSLPRDLRFALAALATSLLGITAAKQLFAAGTCQALLAVIGIWIFTKIWRWNLNQAVFLGAALLACSVPFSFGTLLISAGAAQLLFRPKTLLEAFPLPLCLEIFSAYIFYTALQKTGLDSSLYLIAGLPLTLLMPRPVAFALLFACAQVFLPGQLILAGAIAAAIAAVPLGYRYLKPASAHI